MIPLGLLHDAHYSQNVPKYLNVGSLGLTLAHEILHSLDQMGRGFDENGTRRVSFTIQKCVISKKNDMPRDFICFISGNLVLVNCTFAAFFHKS